MKGWYKESYRHYLARKGVCTAKRMKGMKHELIVGGLGDKKPDFLFNKEQLAAGIKVEMEHTNNPKLAKEIAKDHLTEDKQYYTHLAEMEKKHKKKYMATMPKDYVGFPRKEGDEWVVPVFKDGKRYEPGTYRTEDRANAQGSYNDMKRRLEKNPETFFGDEE